MTGCPRRRNWSSCPAPAICSGSRGRSTRWSFTRSAGSEDISPGTTPETQEADMPFFGAALFDDRRAAGRLLAAALASYRDRDPLVLALPRGGVPVGFEVAKALGAPLDVLIVRKIGAPGHPELGIGEIINGSEQYLVLNEDVIRQVR